ncbi:MAG: transposase [Patescibacteria group bacterium]|nr:transposase [Patescibacteria group bacterium]
MQKQKCSLKLYSNFLIANQNRYSGVELSKVSPNSDMQHDSVFRWLGNSNFTPSDLWNKVKTIVDIQTGYLVGDDSLVSKKYSRKNELAKKQYSGNEHGLLNGICLVNLLWTSREEYVPVDYRIYQKENDDKTKNDHFQDMLKRAKNRGFFPLYVMMDSWYSGINNLKLITRKLDWHFICNLKSNRKVCIRQGNYISIADLDLANKQVRKVWLKEYGYVLVCKLVATNGDIIYLATSDLTLTDYDDFTSHFQNRWKIEEFHRGIKQTTGIEKCSSIKSTSQQTHIFAAFTAFIKLETERLKEHISWYEQKAIISRNSTFSYLSSNA